MRYLRLAPAVGSHASVEVVAELLDELLEVLLDLMLVEVVRTEVVSVVRTELVVVGAFEDVLELLVVEGPGMHWSFFDISRHHLHLHRTAFLDTVSTHDTSRCTSCRWHQRHMLSDPDNRCHHIAATCRTHRQQRQAQERR